MPFTILRTAAGSPVAPFVIASLRALPDVLVVATDSEPLASGLFVADRNRVVPRVDAPDYLAAMLRVCQEEEVDLLFPDLDEELPLLAEARAGFEAIGTRVLVSDPDAIAVCFDKFRTYEFFLELGIPTPWTSTPERIEGGPPLTFPLIVKPRSGRGSRHVFKADRSEELGFFLDYVERPVVQEFVHGVEYTVDTLSDLEGTLLYCSVRERISTDSGISVKGRTSRHPVVESHVRRIVEGLGIVGPACVQCIEDAEGDVRFIEVNPRIAGSAVLSMAAGAPILSDAVRMARGQPPIGPREYRTGMVMLRFWAELFLDDAGRLERPFDGLIGDG